MNSVLVTGATGFVGYHLVKRLHQEGIRPRALVRRTSDLTRLRALGVALVEGDVEDPASLAAAFAGVDTLFHVAGLVNQDPRAAERLRQVNVVGMRHVLDAAAAAGVRRLVATSTVAAVGANRRPVPLTEEADWATHGLTTLYALTKRQGEEEALERARRGLPVVVVNPTIVIGPEDFAPTPGGGLVRDVVRRRIPGSLRMGLSYVDVRDVAEGHLLAARRGQVGRRYLLSTENLMLEEFFRLVAAAAGVPPPRWRVPFPLVWTAALFAEGFAAVSGRSPGVTRRLLEVAGRFSWYDASRARDELGWRPRPFAETVRDTAAWFRSAASLRHGPP
jgi:dihydroflavonol-4-reductase